MKDLKLVYKADTEEIALAQLDELKKKWDNLYGSVIDSWYETGINYLRIFLIRKKLER